MYMEVLVVLPSTANLWGWGDNPLFLLRQLIWVASIGNYFLDNCKQFVCFQI